MKHCNASRRDDPPDRPYAEAHDLEERIGENVMMLLEGMV